MGTVGRSFLELASVVRIFGASGSFWIGIVVTSERLGGEPVSRGDVVPMSG